MDFKHFKNALSPWDDGYAVNDDFCRDYAKYSSDREIWDRNYREGVQGIGDRPSFCWKSDSVGAAVSFEARCLINRLAAELNIPRAKALRAIVNEGLIATGLARRFNQDSDAS